MNIHIYNTFLAGWCAEAVGARLEFQRKQFSDAEVADAFHMVGEKTTGVHPGQITDDSELEIALLSALVECQHDPYFPIELIAKKYIEWHNTDPFDIGYTTTCALLGANSAEDMETNAYEQNAYSESNGSLMRCIPLAVFGINKSPEIVMNIAIRDAELTHSNTLVGEITGLYCILISRILHSKINKYEIHIDSLLELVKSLTTHSIILKWIHTGSSLTTLDGYDCILNEGHVKHAFIFVMYFLKNLDKYDFVRAISEVLKCGGDTDTNAKIVGNLFGAYHGNTVPTYLSEIVVNFDCTKVDDFFKRPYSCSVKYAIELLHQLPF